MTRDQLIIGVPGRPLLVNAVSQNTHWQVSKEKKTWREAAGWAAKARRTPPAPVPCKLTIIHGVKKTSAWAKLPDDVSCYFAFKGARDGLVDAGVLIDDGPAYISSTAFTAPCWAAEDGLTFIIEPVS